MLIASRQSFWNKALPYDSKVEWLETDGYSFIKSGILASSSVEFDIEMSGIWIRDSHIKIPIGYDDYYINSGRREKVFYFGNNSAGGSRIDMLCGNSFIGGTYEWTSMRSMYSFHNFTLFKDGNMLYSPLERQSFFGGGEIFLFSANVPNSGAGDVNKYCATGFKIYSISIDDGNINLKLIPVRFTNENGNNEGAMFDTVSKALFRNSGTGNFIIGPDI